MTKGEFSIYWWAEDGTRITEMNFVDAETAFKRFRGLTGPANLVVDRLIITDGGDSISLEWNYEKSLVFPTKEDIERSRT